MIGHGTTLEGATTGALGKILSVSSSGASRDAIDDSTMDSTNKHVEKIPGMIDPGQTTLDFKYDKTLYNTVLGARDADTEVWTFTLPDTSTLACSGFIVSVSNPPTIPLKDKLTFSVTIEWTGEPTFTPAV